MGRAFNAKNLKSLTPWGFGYRSVMSGYTTVANSPLHFYEKVTKVKADVAALHIFFSDIDAAASAGVESWQGRRSWAFILTLDRSPRHFIIERRTKRNAVQLSFVP